MIKMTRVDHRLLHGQVAFTWIKAVGADCILIANDDVAKDELRMAVLKISKAVFVSDEECAQIRDLVDDGIHVFVQMTPSDESDEAMKLIG